LDGSVTLWDNNSSRVWLGNTGSADTAELRLVRESDGAVEATWSSSSAPADVTLSSSEQISDSDFYHLELRSQNGAGQAELAGVDLKFTPWVAT
jgi:hypothetical protein